MLFCFGISRFYAVFRRFLRKMFHTQLRRAKIPRKRRHPLKETFLTKKTTIPTFSSSPSDYLKHGQQAPSRLQFDRRLNSRIQINFYTVQENQFYLLKTDQFQERQKDCRWHQVSQESFHSPFWGYPVQTLCRP